MAIGRTNNKILTGLGLFFGIGLLAWFCTTVFGAVIGGIAGAVCAVIAVHVTLTRQRSEDIANARADVERK